jgi:hypothetical protein
VNRWRQMENIKKIGNVTKQLKVLTEPYETRVTGPILCVIKYQSQGDGEWRYNSMHY